MKTTWLLSFCFLVNLSLLKAKYAKCPFRATITSGRDKVTCDFSLLCSNGRVVTKSSSAKCFPVVSKKLNFKKARITAKDGCRWVISMLLSRGKGKIYAATYSQCRCCDATTPPPPPPTTTTTTTTPHYQTESRETSETPSNCGPRQCGIWCSDRETCYESENTNCVQAPCCARWQCRASTTPRPPTPPPTPTSAPTPPTVQPTSTCCKERMFKRSVYGLVGVEETLPVCGNDCIYEFDAQLFCFPTSFSELANQCDSVAIPPQLLLGLSPWSAWTACQGDCELESGGRSSRSRSCVADISDELSCVGPSTQLRNCELNCRHEQAKIHTVCNPSTFPLNVIAQGYPCKYHFLPPQSWTDAQTTCKKNFGGQLWEPANSAEYNAVINAAESQANYMLLYKCRWWLGLFNWNDGSPDSIDAYLSSTVNALPTVAPDHNEPTNGPNGVISNFITVTDGQDGGTHNCVHTGYSGWFDDRCIWERPFICQECPPPCNCSFNGVFYPCGSIIKRNPHCCSSLICDNNGMIVDQQLYGSNGKPAAGCCIWRGRMYQDGDKFGPWWARKVCCRGEILFSPLFYPLFYPFGQNAVN